MEIASFLRHPTMHMRGIHNFRCQLFFFFTVQLHVYISLFIPLSIDESRQFESQLVRCDGDVG